MRRLVLGVLIVVLATSIAIGFIMSRQSSPAEPEDFPDLTIHIPRGNLYGGPSFGRQLDVSPDGKQIVYVGQAGKGSRTLFVHTIGENEPVEIPESMPVIATFVIRRFLRMAAMLSIGHKGT